jgi:hypothetical protein
MNPQKPQCKALTKAGLPCLAAPMASGLCFFHTYPNKASELGQVGGRKNRKTNQIENKLSALAFDSPNDRLENLYQAVLNGRIHHQRASVLIRITHEQILARETTARDEEIARLRRELEEIKLAIGMGNQENFPFGYDVPESESEDRDEHGGVD